MVVAVTYEDREKKEDEKILILQTKENKEHETIKKIKVKNPPDGLAKKIEEHISTLAATAFLHNA